MKIETKYSIGDKLYMVTNDHTYLTRCYEVKLKQLFVVGIDYKIIKIQTTIKGKNRLQNRVSVVYKLSSKKYNNWLSSTYYETEIENQKEHTFITASKEKAAKVQKEVKDKIIKENIERRNREIADVKQKAIKLKIKI